MAIKKILREDLFGRFFVKKPDGEKWESYYKTIEALRPLFAREEFKESVNGFYLNIAGNFDTVRISYFVDEQNRDKAVSIFRQYFKDNRLLETGFAPPRTIILALHYGGEKYEERFRTFLNLETQIGLDLIKGNLLHARILFAIYRWQIRKASLPFREHFEPTFEKYSLIYNALSEEEKREFFADLKMWPNPPQVDWAHMMVNFVLGCDWNTVFGDPNYLTPGKPLSISEINEIVKPLKFQIPSDWNQ
jgi:hypothetical protein